ARDRRPHAARNPAGDLYGQGHRDGDRRVGRSLMSFRAKRRISNETLHCVQGDNLKMLMATEVLGQTATDQRIADQVRRYTIRLAVCLIIGVNALFLLVLWGSGVDLDQIFAERDFFDPTRDICLRMAWYK